MVEEKELAAKIREEVATAVGWAEAAAGGAAFFVGTFAGK